MNLVVADKSNCSSYIARIRLAKIVRKMGIRSEFTFMLIAINMNVNSERMPIFLTIFASLILAIYDEQLDLSATTKFKTTPNVSPRIL